MAEVIGFLPPMLEAQVEFLAMALVGIQGNEPVDGDLSVCLPCSVAFQKM